MFNQILTWLTIILIVGFMVVTVFALKKSFVTINNNIDSNDKEIHQLINNQLNLFFQVKFHHQSFLY